MKYKSDVPKKNQIRMSEFKLLPGDTVLYEYQKKVFYTAKVIEVGSANPEYVLGGPEAEGAGMVVWTENEREDCRNFLLGSERFPVRLKKSMWAVIQYVEKSGLSGNVAVHEVSQKKLYTYDIERMIGDGSLEIIIKKCEIRRK